jgi:carboxymethylenebutenolidase
MSTQPNPSAPAGPRLAPRTRSLADACLDNYRQGHVSRRDALKRLTALIGSLLVAEGLLSACDAGPVAEATPAPGPTAVPSVEGEDVTYPGQGASIIAYRARPSGAGPFPGVLICHENRGLLEHFKDLARRFAKEGYVALAVDLLAREGGTDKIADQGQVPALLSATPPEQRVQDFRDGMAYLQSLSYVRKDRIGMTGFCFGGGVTWRCATQLPELRAAVPFYGPNPPLEDVPNIRAAVLAVYAGNDERINAGIPSIEKAMAAAGKPLEKIVYPGTEHAFFNDTGQRFNAEAAANAWKRMLAWFGTHLA